MQALRAQRPRSAAAHYKMPIWDVMWQKLVDVDVRSGLLNGSTTMPLLDTNMQLHKTERMRMHAQAGTIPSSDGLTCPRLLAARVCAARKGG
jgi:hypothetical protein